MAVGCGRAAALTCAVQWFTTGQYYTCKDVLLAQLGANSCEPPPPLRALVLMQRIARIDDSGQCYALIRLSVQLFTCDRHC